MSLLTAEDYMVVDYAIDIIEDFTAYPEILFEFIYEQLAKNQFLVLEYLRDELIYIYQNNLMTVTIMELFAVEERLESLMVSLDFRTNGTEVELKDDDLTTNHFNEEEELVLCQFCKKNGEPYGVYTAHNVRNKFGIVTCPVLRRYTCPKCGASGNSAHTLKYCPQMQ